MEKKVVNNWNEALDLIDGLLVELDGIQGNIKVERVKSKHYGYITTKVMHHPTQKGKKHKNYLEFKKKLKDDWSTDLTDSERLSAIMEKLGIVFAE